MALRTAGARPALGRLAGVCAVALAALGPGLASACDPRLSLDYVDDSPSDTLTITNLSQSHWSLVGLEIDLASAAEKLVFDVSEGGPGYSVFVDPMGADVLGVPTLEAEDKVLIIRTKPIAPGASTLLYLDLDEVGDRPGTYVAPAALMGARARARFRRADGSETEAEGVFEENAVAILSPPACV